ncbi:hypothetical protein Tco_1316329 [Tanacetum coccineum]
MTTLQFADTHNLVMFLSKPAESEGFEQIVNFLNANSIKYALPINPTIYTSCIEQFRATVKVKTINREVQLQALVDGKKIIVTKASVRCDLQLNDVEGTDCLPNATIFEELTRIGKPKRKDTKVPQPSGPTNNVADKAVYKEMDDSLERAVTTATSLDADSDSSPKRQETMGDTIAQTGFENVSETSNDLLVAGFSTPRSDEDSLKLKELMELCTNLQNRLIDLEKTKTSQAQEIISLKRRVKRLEKKNRSKTHGLKRLYKVGLSARIESSEDEGLGEEDASKQRRIDDIDSKEDIYLDNVHRDEDMFGVNDLERDVDEVTLVQALAALKSAKPKADKAKGLVIHEEEQATTPIVSSQQPSHVKVQDKGKGIMGGRTFEDEEERSTF